MLYDIPTTNTGSADQHKYSEYSMARTISLANPMNVVLDKEVQDYEPVPEPLDVDLKKNLTQCRCWLWTELCNTANQ